VTRSAPAPLANTARSTFGSDRDDRARAMTDRLDRHAKRAELSTGAQRAPSA
jgi:hypothetical protein